MYIIQDDTGRFLTQYLTVSCNFQYGEEKAIRFDSKQRAIKVYRIVTGIIPSYVKINIVNVNAKRQRPPTQTEDK